MAGFIGGKSYTAGKPVTGYDPSPGSVLAGPEYSAKYPAPPGSSYQHYGEQQGYTYDPYTDHYYPDPQASADYYHNTGLVKDPPKSPGLLGQLAPIAAGALALGTGTYLGKEAIPAVGDAFSGLGSVLGGGAASASPAGALGVGPVADPGIYGSMISGGGGAAPGTLPATDLPAWVTDPTLMSGPGPGQLGLGVAGPEEAAAPAYGAAPLAADLVGGALIANAGMHALDAVKHGTRAPVEANKWAALAQQGITPPPGFTGDKKDPYGFKAQNPQYAETGQEYALKPEEAANVAWWYQKFGPGWSQLDQQTRNDIADQALKQGIFDEREGGYYVHADKEFDNFVKQRAPRLDTSSWFDKTAATTDVQKGEALRGQHATNALRPGSPFGMQPSTIDPYQNEIQSNAAGYQQNQGNSAFSTGPAPQAPAPAAGFLNQIGPRPQSGTPSRGNQAVNYKRGSGFLGFR